MGAGKSKKEAKHAAAKMLIDKITGNSCTDLQLVPAAVPAPVNGEVVE